MKDEFDNLDAHDPIRHLVEALSGEADPTNELPGETLVMSEFRKAHETDVVDVTTRKAPAAGWGSRTTAVIAAAGLVLAGGAAAAAASGGLPGAASPKAVAALQKAGVVVAGPNDAAGTNPDTRGKSAHSTPAADETAPPQETPKPTTSPTNHGSVISQLARTTTATGRAKGALISAAASGGKSHAGQTRPTPKPTNPAPSNTHKPTKP